MNRLLNESIKPNGIRVLVFQNAKGYTKTPDEIPNLFDIKDLPAFKNGEPTYKIEAIEYPCEGSGGIYTEQFFKSFVNGIKERPYPGSKRGHEYVSRPNTDFYTVGGLLESKGEGSGVVYLKMAIPEKLDSDNFGFINDLQSGNVHFSLVTLPDGAMKKDKDGTTKWHFMKSVGRERNDAVEYGAGAMGQRVNSEDIEIDFDIAKELIENGMIDKKTKTDGPVIQDGKVFYCALGREVAKAQGESKTALAELISTIDKKYKNKGGSMDKEEILSGIVNLVKNGQVSNLEVAKLVGIHDKIRNEADEKNAETVKQLNEKLGEDPFKAIDTMIKENKDNAELLVINSVINVVGPKTVKNGKGEDSDNKAYLRAIELCSGKKGEDLKTALNSLGEDYAMKEIRANMADPFSRINRLEDGVATSQPVIGNDGVKTIRIGG